MYRDEQDVISLILCSDESLHYTANILLADTPRLHAYIDLHLTRPSSDV